MGLAVAIPGLLMGRMLDRKEENIAMELDKLKDFLCSEELEIKTRVNRKATSEAAVAARAQLKQLQESIPDMAAASEAYLSLQISHDTLKKQLAEQQMELQRSNSRGQALEELLAEGLVVEARGEVAKEEVVTAVETVVVKEGVKEEEEMAEMVAVVEKKVVAVSMSIEMSAFAPVLAREATAEGLPGVSAPLQFRDCAVSPLGYLVFVLDVFSDRLSFYQ